MLFGVIGCLVGAALHVKFGKYQLTMGVIYYSLMEWLQAAQYMYINDCSSKENKLLTILGVAHILFQVENKLFYLWYKFIIIYVLIAVYDSQNERSFCEN